VVLVPVPGLVALEPESVRGLALVSGLVALGPESVLGPVLPVCSLLWVLR
jgi:hypothetical protein